MSDEQERPMMLRDAMLVNFLNDPERMAKLKADCEAALQNQLNINKRNPVLSALETKWKTMDAFSKRELGKKEY